MPHRLDQAQLRVLGCLIEKQRTTPDQYPLSLNALRLACNQSSNRDPVLDLDESQVHETVQTLGRIGFARLASGPGSRAVKYRHLFDEALGLDPAETAVLAVLIETEGEPGGEEADRGDRDDGARKCDALAPARGVRPRQHPEREQDEEAEDEGQQQRVQDAASRRPRRPASGIGRRNAGAARSGPDPLVNGSDD